MALVSETRPPLAKTRRYGCGRDVIRKGRKRMEVVQPRFAWKAQPAWAPSRDLSLSVLF